MNIKDGGGAFPQVPQLDLGKDGEIKLRCDGISVLDYFAAAALTGLLANSDGCEYMAEHADMAYCAAIAMLSERESRNKP
ncbi:hypothetical protein LCGC14_0451100 [marine sediment metagenome]|uniref:Uncharacterized protein n=1 Tax=marine sediment metagenome TaxID=412755 RepID=A0A0F9SN76_9ZZZZ